MSRTRITLCGTSVVASRLLRRPYSARANLCSYWTMSSPPLKMLCNAQIWRAESKVYPISRCRVPFIGNVEYSHDERMIAWHY